MSDGCSSSVMRRSRSSSSSASASRASSSPRPRLKSSITETASACASNSGLLQSSRVSQRRAGQLGRGRAQPEVEQDVREPELQHHAIGLAVSDLIPCLLEHRAGGREAVGLEPHLAEQQQRPRPRRPRREHANRLLERRTSPRRVTGIEVVFGYSHAELVAAAQLEGQLQ